VPNILRTLDIHNNQIDSVENYFSLKDGYELEYLDASRNRIRSLGVLSLLPSLETIIIHNNKISDIGHNTFLNKENLTPVDLRSNNLSVISLASLSVAKGLKNAKPSFLMTENPFHCSCQMQWIVNQANGDRLP
jgi:Leucine-rich repeat (LRR) protein